MAGFLNGRGFSSLLDSCEVKGTAASALPELWEHSPEAQLMIQGVHKGLLRLMLGC